MEIDNSILTEFLKKATLNSKIPTIKILDSGDGIKTHLTLMGSINVKSWLSEKLFHNYTPLEMNIRDSQKFNNILKSFKGKILLQLEHNFIKIWNDNKNVLFKSASLIENHIEGEGVKLPYDNGVDVLKSFFDEVLTNINNCDAKYVEFDCNGKVLILKAVGDEDEIEEMTTLQYKPCKFIMSSEYFKNIFNSLDNEKLNISMQDLSMLNEKPPMKITDKSSNYNVQVWVGSFNPE